MYRKLLINKGANVQTMIDILNCDVKQFDYVDEEDLDTLVDFRDDFGSMYTCRLRDIQYTYRFCKRLLEMCRDANYLD